jgi:membrane protein implicated in regulation of membrane protease activity
VTVTRTLFKERVSKFGSLISLLALITMLTLFSLFMPELIASVAGRVFVVFWAMIAIIAFIAHARTIKSVGRHPYHRLQAMTKKEERTRKRIRPERLMREL